MAWSERDREVPWDAYLRDRDVHRLWDAYLRDRDLVRLVGVELRTLSCTRGVRAPVANPVVEPRLSVSEDSESPDV